MPSKKHNESIFHLEKTLEKKGFRRLSRLRSKGKYKPDLIMIKSNFLLKRVMIMLLEIVINNFRGFEEPEYIIDLVKKSLTFGDLCPKERINELSLWRAKQFIYEVPSYNKLKGFEFIVNYFLVLDNGIVAMKNCNIPVKAWYCCPINLERIEDSLDTEIE